ncbi:MAG TPA: lipopolysaccharide biosynthesis protein [Steroidobacteraceae bacterium]|nr:lipopolysaccharide biosynthesis protein [Steroidobacteraceae bacterium]
MAGLANRTASLTLVRLANYGLMLVSPIILVRVLSVVDFGRYREFLLYASLLQSVGGFVIYDSLLYFIPAHPESPWRTVRQSVALVFGSTLITAVVLVLADVISGGAIVGHYLWPLVLYLMFSVNLDFWEYYWLANSRPAAMFAYSGGRLVIRLLVVTSAAVLTHDVATIIWCLVGLEGLRLTGAAIAFRLLDNSRNEPPLDEPWRAQLRFCMPSGTGSLLSILNRNLSNVVVAKVLGVAALAQFAIGRFGEPIVAIVRNSISAVVLPEMVRRSRDSRANPLALWRRATVINALLLLPIVVLVARYAEPLVVTVFGAKYRPAAMVMQIYMLVIVRECFDFAPALRAINRASPLVFSNLAALLAGGVALFILVPRAGVNGAVAAAVLASFVDAAWLGRSVAKFNNVRFRDLVPWRSMGLIAIAAALAASVVISSIWTDKFGFVGIVLASVSYLAVYCVLLKILRVPEAAALFESVKRTVAGGSGA